MGGVPVKHHSKSKVGRRRAHLGLARRNILVCAQCRAPKLAHRVCVDCGARENKRRATGE